MKSYSHFKLLFITLLIILFGTNILAQNVMVQTERNSLSGMITDAETGNPIPNVEVFISGTSIGCTTNKDGEYKLEYLYLPITLIAHHVSYKSFIKKIVSEIEKLDIELKQDIKPIAEVKIAGKNNRKKNLRFFKSRFIPNYKNKIKIINDSVLLFNRSETDFTAFSNEPLIINNNLLGYRMKLLLKNFSIYRTRQLYGQHLPLNSIQGKEMMTMTGYFYYEPLVSKIEKINRIHKKNRIAHYFGSYRHFLKALYDNDLENQGYKIFTYPDFEETNAFIEINNIPLAEEQSKYFTIQGDSLVVDYYYDPKSGMPVNKEKATETYYIKESKIFAGKGIFEIRPNGTSPDVNFLIIGPMAPSNNPANSFPEDYEPEIIIIDDK